MQQIICSTGALIGRPNGRDYRLLKQFCPRLECDGFEFIMYGTWYNEVDAITEFLTSIGLNIPVMHSEKSITELLPGAEGKRSGRPAAFSGSIAGWQKPSAPKRS